MIVAFEDKVKQAVWMTVAIEGKVKTAVIYDSNYCG